MSRPKVLLIGATGNTGGSILEAMLAADQFDIELLIRPTSLPKPAVQALLQRDDLSHRVVDLDLPEDALVPALAGIDILISTLGPATVAQEKTLVRAAKRAGVQRFVPSSWVTVAPPRGAMLLREEKEEILAELRAQSMDYTVIDVGYWYQLSLPPVPSGRLSYAIPVPSTTIHGDGTAPNILTDLRDIGRFVARIVADPRTRNRSVYTCSAVLSEEEIFGIVEAVSGESVGRGYESEEETLRDVDQALAELAADPTDFWKRAQVYLAQYRCSKYVRRENTPQKAAELGYLDARALYPDLRTVGFGEFVGEVLAGRGRNPYPRSGF
ncbi:NAD(P)-binding protein [Aspergillus aculeatinus CBS 121060]|uniref:NAD(P)-binding protein n=1 Tax=Aspergillus aculeatinus CBS 121060 TaxID=1448322 RepID=A0ACD1HHR7_9EURO|nr:NAD(P)-binding protein [Aspergillus aculeatinus CBS 121060]RAH73056.1 NAD(P)-binding protein [Aspergillus aculeatinus CBS 121060]